MSKQEIFNDYMDKIIDDHWEKLITEMDDDKFNAPVFRNIYSLAFADAITWYHKSLKNGTIKYGKIIVGTKNGKIV